MLQFRRFFTTAGLLAVLTLVGACGSTTSSNGTTPATNPATTVPDTTVVPTTTPDTTVAPTTLPDTVAPTTTAPSDVQFAIWPAADVVFTTPEAAANDFLAQVFGDGPVLGEFIPGDARSGEFEVFATADGAVIDEARSTLLLRQLGPSDGWFVLAAISDTATITSPAAYGSVTAGPLDVAGDASGYEATISISAFVAGDATRLDQQTAMAGNFGELLPYRTTLDLSAADVGDVVVVLVIGTTGLESDPGSFSAVPVVVS